VFISWNLTNAHVQYPNLPTTRIVFDDDNAVVTAIMKGHLLTNAIQGSTNQARKIASNDVVYTSGLNTLWTTHWNGSAWSTEARLAESRINPSINNSSLNGLQIVAEEPQDNPMAND